MNAPGPANAVVGNKVKDSKIAIDITIEVIILKSNIFLYVSLTFPLEITVDIIRIGRIALISILCLIIYA